MAVTTLVDLLEDRAAAAPDATAYIFLEDGESDARSITRGALATRAHAIAALLATPPGERVLLVLPPGLDYIAAFFGCLYAGVIAVPAYPPDPRRLARTLPRLVAIARAADARTLVTTKAAASALAAVPELAGIRCVAIDDATASAASARPRIERDAVAMLQFTSGSTSSPRGVVLAHANLLANLAAISDAFGLAGRPPRIASWLPPYHDMGLIGAILSSLYAGGMTVAMSPLHFLQRPARWLRMIHTYRADISGGPNFAFDLCARKVDLASEALDLSCWEVAFDGAEVVRAATLDRFATMFAPAGFRRSALFPCYGLAETCLLVSGARRGEGPTVMHVDRAALEQGEVVQRADAAAPADSAPHVAVVSSGRPPTRLEVVIVDPVSCVVLRDGRVGEIWVRGDSVGRGYWGREDDSARTFAAHTADGRGPYLRTGDLGFVVDGELVVSGRIKDVIVIYGRKLFPDDIERVIAGAHVCVRPGGVAAIAFDADDREQLGVVVETEGSADAAEVRAAITRAVVESFDVAPAIVMLVGAGELPKTSSGKVQRHACRALLREVRGE